MTISPVCASIRNCWFSVNSALLSLNSQTRRISPGSCITAGAKMVKWGTVVSIALPLFAVTMGLGQPKADP